MESFKRTKSTVMPRIACVIMCSAIALLVSTCSSSDLLTKDHVVSRSATTSSASLPAHWDWREQGKVTPVRNQGQCGSSWAFAAVAAVESKILILENVEMDLSEQQLVSCGGGGTCGGGHSAYALDYIRDHGLVSEPCFTYQAKDIACAPCQQSNVAKIEDHYSVYPYSGPTITERIQLIKEAIYKDGPVVVYMNVYEDLQSYDSGVYTHTYGPLLGMHAVLLVGYDDADGYWIVKNSWDTWWGENGFFRMSYDAGVDLYEWPPMAVLRTDHNGDGIWDGIKGQSPIASAGSGQTVHVGSVVTLDGSGSSDPNDPPQTPLSYAWELTVKPDGSTAAFVNPATVNPTFTPDVLGDYTASLTVTNAAGIASTPSTVVISTTNTAPIADAGPDQAVILIGSTVQLDGSKSWDSDGDQITCQWTFTSVPLESSAVLSNPTSSMPSFIADVHGTYAVRLIVSDPWANSTPASVNISFTNVKPVANAGTSQSAVVSDMVALNGSESSDANHDPLTYSWSFTAIPAGSQITIADPKAIATSFVPDLPGPYVVQLIVNDGFVNSDPVTIQVQVISRQTEVINAIRNLELVVGSLAGVLFKNPNMKNALINKLNAVISAVTDGNYRGALDHLQNDILGKTDGCAVSGAPDKNDWIINCQGQERVYPDVLQIIQQLQGMI